MPTLPPNQVALPLPTPKHHVHFLFSPVPMSPPASEVNEDRRPLPSWEESYADTESEISEGFDEVLNRMQSVRSGIDYQMGSSAESSSAGQQEGAVSADQQEGLRHRTGQCLLVAY